MVTHILYPFLLMSLIDDLSTTLSHSPSTFANFSDLIDINWIEKSLEWTGKASIRKRKLHAEHVVWLVIGLALFRGQPIWYVVQQFELVFGASDYCFPGAEVQARQGLGQEHLMDLFLTLSQAWFKEKLVTQESYQDLQVLAVDGVIWLMPHPRTRERFLALYEVATGSTATQVSRHT